MVAATNNEDPPEIARVLGAGLGERLATAGKSFLDSFTQDAVLEFPVSSDPKARRIEGKAAALAFPGRANKEIALQGAALDKTYVQVGADTVVLEYHAVADGLTCPAGWFR